MARQRSGPRRHRKNRGNGPTGFGLGPRPGVEINPLDPIEEDDEPLNPPEESIRASIEEALRSGEFNREQIRKWAHFDIPGVKRTTKGVFDRDAISELGLEPPSESDDLLQAPGRRGGGFLVPPEMRNRVSREPVLDLPDDYLLNIRARDETPEQIEALLKGDIDPRAGNATALAEILPNTGVPLSDLSLEEAARNAMKPGVQALEAQGANTARHANVAQLPPEERVRLAEAHGNDVRPPAPTHHVNGPGVGPDPALEQIAARDELRNPVPPQSAVPHVQQTPGVSRPLTPGQVDQLTNSAPAATQASAFLNRPNAAPTLTGDPVTDQAIQLAQAQLQAPVGGPSSPFDHQTFGQQAIREALARLGVPFDPSEMAQMGAVELHHRFRRPQSPSDDVIDQSTGAGNQVSVTNSRDRGPVNLVAPESQRIDARLGAGRGLSSVDEGGRDVQVAQWLPERWQRNAAESKHTRPAKGEPGQRTIELPELGIEVRGPIDKSNTNVEKAAKAFEMIGPAILASGDEDIISAWEWIQRRNDIVVVTYHKPKITGAGQLTPSETRADISPDHRITFFPKAFFENGNERTQCQIATTALHEVLHKAARYEIAEEDKTEFPTKVDFEEHLTKEARRFLNEWGVCPQEE